MTSSPSPYRSDASKAPRYRVLLDGAVYEGERFGEIVSQLRAAGHDTATVRAVADLVLQQAARADLQIKRRRFVRLRAAIGRARAAWSFLLASL